MLDRIASLVVVIATIVAASSADAAQIHVGSGSGACPPGNICLYEYGVFNSGAPGGRIMVLGSGEPGGAGYPLANHGFQELTSAVVNNTPGCLWLHASSGGLSPLTIGGYQSVGDLGVYNNNTNKITFCGNWKTPEEVASLDAGADLSARVLAALAGRPSSLSPATVSIPDLLGQPGRPSRLP